MWLTGSTFDNEVNKNHHLFFPVLGFVPKYAGLILKGEISARRTLFGVLTVEHSQTRHGLNKAIEVTTVNTDTEVMVLAKEIIYKIISRMDKNQLMGLYVSNLSTRYVTTEFKLPKFASGWYKFKKPKTSAQFESYYDLIIRSRLNDFMDEPELKPNIVRMLPKVYNLTLSRPLRSVFLRDRKTLNVVFKMEDAGILFIGDIIKLREKDLLLYTEDPSVIDKITTYIANCGLEMEMQTPSWKRPAPFSLIR